MLNCISNTCFDTIIHGYSSKVLNDTAGSNSVPDTYLYRSILNDIIKFYEWILGNDQLSELQRYRFWIIVN